MKRIFLYGLLFYVSNYYCEAQKLEINYYPTFHVNSKCIIMYKGDSCILQLDIIDKKDSSKIIWTEISVIPVKHLDKVNRMFEMANHLSPYKALCLDGMQVSGMFENDTSYNEFVFECPPTKKDIIQYDFLIQINRVMLNVLKNRKSKRYVRAIREYL